MPDPAPLWTVAELASFMRYAIPTVRSLLSRSPDKLPPRVSACGAPRWHPATVEAWAAQQSRPATPRKGRPRQVA